MKRVLVTVALVGGALLLIGCGPDGPINIVNTQTIWTGDGSTPTPTPTPMPGSGGMVAEVSVGFFARSCSGPLPVAPTDFRVGCTGRATATPRNAAGNKLDPKDHGEVIRWFYEYGSAVLQSTPDTDNQFNRDVVALTPGDYRLCAEVRGAIGCVEGAVTN